MSEEIQLPFGVYRGTPPDPKAEAERIAAEKAAREAKNPTSTPEPEPTPEV